MDRVPEADEAMTTDERINAVRQLYHMATNKDNPNRHMYKLDPEMIGRISSKIMSYNLYDNRKYQLIEELLQAIEEILGPSEDQSLGLQLKHMKTFVPDGKIQDLEGNVINMASESGVMEDNASQSSRSSL